MEEQPHAGLLERRERSRNIGPFIKPTTRQTAYFGGIEIIIRPRAETRRTFGVGGLNPPWRRAGL
jgi:hypothetical protein